MPHLKIITLYLNQRNQRNLRNFFARSLAIFLCLELLGGSAWVQTVYGNPGQVGPAAGASADTSVIGASSSLKTLTSTAPSFNYSSIISSNFDQKMQQACQGTDIAGAARSFGSTALNLMSLKGTGAGPGAGMSGAYGMLACTQAMSAPAALQASIVSATTAASTPGSSASVGTSFASSSIQAACPGSDLYGINMSPMSCEMYASPEMLKTAVDFQKSQYQSVLCGAQCKEDMVGVIQNQVTCLQQQASVLTELGTNLGQAFQREYNYARNQNLKFKTDIQNRETQEKNVDLVLKGQEGTPGLIKQRDDTLKIVNQDIPQKMAEMQRGLTEIENSKSIIKSAVAQRKMAAAMDCIKTTKMPNLRCTPNGETVSVKDYLSCKVSMNSVLGSSGGSDSNIINQGGIFKSMGEANKNKWMSAFDMIERAAPSDLNAPLEGAGGGKSAGGYAILTPADVAKVYGSQLSGIKVPQFDVSKFFNDSLKYCYSLSSINIDKASTLSSSDIYKAEFNQNQNLKKLQADVQSSLGSYNQAYAQNVLSMTGNTQAIQGYQCDEQAPAKQTTCIKKSLDSIQQTSTKLRQQLTGTPLRLNVKGISNNFNVSCQGLNGCITALNTAKINIQTDRQNLTTAKENFNQAEYIKEFCSRCRSSDEQGKCCFKSAYDSNE
jgi:hypothetical protein